MKANPRQLLQRYHRRVLWQRPVLILTMGVCLALVLREASPRWPLLILGLAALASLAARFIRPPTLSDSARALDQKINTQNRIEALAELGSRTDPLATAANQEAAAFLNQAPPLRNYAWYFSLGLLLVSLVLTGACFLFWKSAPPNPLTPGSTPALIAPTAPEPLLPPQAVLEPMSPASLRWITPEENIAATDGEKIPLIAEAISTTGLDHVTLHRTYNCDPAQATDEAVTIASGTQFVTLSLPLGTIKAQPYDIITYYISAERIRTNKPAGTKPWPTLYSSLQFIQIHSLRDDTTPAPLDDNFSNDAARLLARVQRLKLAQLMVVKDSFDLAHEEPSRSESAPPASINDLIVRQKRAATDAIALLQRSEPFHLPAAALALIDQAKAAMTKAASALEATQLDLATDTARCALVHLAAAERFYAEFLAEQISGTADATNLTQELPPREQTPAGRLEQLAREQQAIAQQLGQGLVTPDTFAQQDQLARAMEKLARENELPAATIASIASAAIDARAAAAQLNENDPQAAVEPSTRAAQKLAEAISQLEAAARAQASAQLAAAQRQLLRAATDIRKSTPEGADKIAKKLETLRAELNQAAFQQQERGSAAAARSLKEAASAIDTSKIHSDLEILATKDSAPRRAEKQAAARKLTALAKGVAENRLTIEDAQQMQARALSELRRSLANLERAAKASPDEFNEVYENAVANAQIAAATGVTVDLPSPPDESGLSLRWITPAHESQAGPEDTVALSAEADSVAGFGQLSLLVSLNGKPQPAIRLGPMPTTDLQRVDTTIALAPLKVKNGDTVAYQLSAAAHDPAAHDNLISIVQFIRIAAAKDENSESSKSSEPVPPAIAILQDKALRLKTDQIALLNDTTLLAQNRTPTALALSALVARQTALKETCNKLKDECWEAGLPEAVIRKLGAVTAEMTAAVKELQKNAPASAVPPQMRAVALLSDFGNSSGNGAAGSALGEPAPKTNSADRGHSARQTEFAKAFAPQLDLLIRRLDETIRGAKRTQTLTTGNPADAPSAYRPAVANYFESLASEPTRETKGTAPKP